MSGPQRPPLLSFLQGVVETILVKKRRVGEAREGGEEPRIFSFAPDGGFSDKLWRESSDAFPILEVVDVDLVFDLLPSVNRYFLFELEGKPAHISLVHDHEIVLDQCPELEFRILLFRNQILPCESLVRDIDCNDLLSRCILIGYEVEECTVVSDANNGIRIDQT